MSRTCEPSKAWQRRHVFPTPPLLSELLDARGFDRAGIERYLSKIDIPVSADEFSRLDQGFYRRQVGFKIPKREFERHYLESGWRLGLNPNRWFDGEFYLSQYPDVKAADTNPFLHFLIFGWRELRAPAGHETRGKPSKRSIYNLPQIDLFEINRYLSTVPFRPSAIDLARVDEAFYRKQSRANLAPGISAEHHFHHEGWRMGLDPNPFFDTKGYRKENPDVRAAEIDPLLHFLVHGWKEGRQPAPNETEQRASRVIQLRRNPDPLKLANTTSLDVPIVSKDRLGELITQQLLPNSTRLIVAIGHDNYTRNIGGIQMVAGVEQRKFEALGFNYLYVYPAHDRLAFAPTEDYLVEAVYNGKTIPARFTIEEIFGQVGTIEGVIIHSLYGHSPEPIREVVAEHQPDKKIWWIHDYSIHCENHLLLHNQHRFCNDPPPLSQLCRVCVFGERRAEYLRRMSILRDGFDWTFVAPSSAASDNVMSGSTRLKNPPVVMPHGRIVFNPGQTLDHTNIDRLRVAFVGHPTDHKGWDVFKQLAKSCHRRADSVDFFHFGATSDECPLIDFVETRQTFDTNGLTTRLLMDKGVHAVVAWSSWPETFNIVCYEAMAAGCVIICPENSGNVLFASRQYGRDVCYSNERDLIDDERFAQRIITKLGEETQQGCFEYEGTSTVFFVGGSL